MTETVKAVVVGDPVRVVTETYEEVIGLVTAIHGSFDSSYVPCINVLYVSQDESKLDSYGRQIERLSSLQHVSQSVGMTRPGRYYEAL